MDLGKVEMGNKLAEEKAQESIHVLAVLFIKDQDSHNLFVSHKECCIFPMELFVSILLHKLRLICLIWRQKALHLRAIGIPRYLGAEAFLNFLLIVSLRSPRFSYFPQYPRS